MESGYSVVVYGILVRLVRVVHETIELTEAVKFNQSEVYGEKPNALPQSGK